MCTDRRLCESAPVALRTRAIPAAAATAALVIAGFTTLTIEPAAAANKPCTIVGTSGDDVIRGTAGDDVICALGGDDKVIGLGGDDIIRGGRGNDVLRGGPGDDVVSGGRGDDRVFGQGGDDVVRGDMGDDKIVGGPGNDRLGGFRGSDDLDGFDKAKFTDVLRCGPGADTAGGDPADLIRNDCETVSQNDAPTDITLSPSSIAENMFEGTDIGDLAAADPDLGDDATFTLVPGAGSADNGQVDIDGDSLESAAEYDFETQPLLHVRIRATDDGGLFVERTFTVSVTDVNDAPVSLDDTVSTVEDTTLELPVSGAGSPVVNDTDQDGDALTVTAVSAPTGGTVNISAGQIHFSPTTNLCGASAGHFTDTVSDGHGGTDTGQVTVDITCVDDDPTAVDDDRTVTEDATAANLNVLANDTDPEGDPITVASVSDPSHGTTAIIASSTNLSYAPDADYCNDPPPYDTFTYTINGGDSATVRMTVTCVNDAPVAVDDAKTVIEDTPLTFPSSDLTSNDTDADVDVLTVTAVSGSVGGTVQLSAGDITFTPALNLCTPSAASFDYTVSDGNGGTDTGHVTVTVACVDDPPVAVDDDRTVTEDSGPTTFGTLLDNDSDVEGDPISITAATQPGHGSTTFTASGVTYTPADDYCGPDVFVYTINGGDVANVSVTVTCVNDAPVVDLDTTSGGSGSTVTFLETDPHTGNGVLIAPDAGITDVDDSSIEGATITLTSRPDGNANESLSFTAAHGIGGSYVASTGVLALTGTATTAQYAAAIASIRYDNTVNPPTTSARTITVVVSDGDDTSATSTATVQIQPDNLPPVNTVPASATTAEDTDLVFTSGLSISVADADTGSLSVTVTVTHGVFTLSGTAGLTVSGNGTPTVTLAGTIAAINSALNNSTFLPALNYNGPAQLTIATTDGIATDTDSVAITVTPVNDAPTATNLSAAESYTEDTSKDLVDIVVSDVDDTTTTVTMTLSNPALGALSVATAGTVTSTYIPGTGVWTASGAISSVNTLLAGVTFIPAPDVNASFAIATSVSDGSLSATGSKAMTGIPVNDAPTSVAPGAQTTDEDVAKAITGMSVADVDDANLAVTLSVTHGTLTLAALSGLSFGAGDGTADATMTFSGTIANLNAAIATVTYAPAADYNGPAALTFTVNDGLASPVTKTVDITVTPVNDAPVADDESFGGAGNRAIGNTVLIVDDPADGAPTVTGPSRTISGSILAGDTDVDGSGPLQVVPGNLASNDGGSVSVQADGDFVFTPKVGTSCSDTSDFFDYTVTDGDSPTPGTDVGRVTIEITDCVWYVDAAAVGGGDGSSGAPYNSLVSLNGAGGAGDVDGAGQTFFLYTGTYSTGLELEGTQKLFGQSHGLSVDGTQLVAAGGTNPSIANPGGHALTLASGDTIQGISLGSTPAGSASLKGTTVGTATMDTVTGGAITNATGGAVDISGGTLAMTFSSVSSTGATGNGIRLDNTAGTFTANGGSITNATGADVAITGDGSGDTVGFTYGGNVADATGTAVTISHQSGGTKTLSGAVGAGAVSLADNTGATIELTGGVQLSTGTSPAFTATGGGTVTVTQNNTSVVNTLTTSTGTALNLANTTIGGAGLTFRSISSNGAANGIVLNATGGSGGLTVSGNGGTCTSVGTCTGGTIQASTASGILLTSTSNTSLTRMLVQTSNEDGIEGTSVTGLNLTGALITNNGDDSEDVGVGIDNLLGTNSWSDVSVTASELANVMVENTSGTLASFIVTGASHFDNLGTAFGGNSMVFNIHGTATLTSGSITGATFSGNKPARGITVQAQDTATIGSFTVQNSTFASDGLGASFEQAHSANHTFAFLGNTVTGSAPGQGVNVASSSTSTGGSLTGQINNNLIGTTGVVDSGSTTGDGIRVFTQGGTVATLTISGNVVREVPNARGIDITGLGTTSGGGLKRFKVTGNTIVRPSGSNQSLCGPANTPCPLASIFVTSDSFGVAQTVCSVITGNTAYDPTSYPLGGEAAYTLGEVADPGHTSSHQVEGAGGSVSASILATNTVTNQTSAPTQVDAGVGLVAVGACGTFP